MKEEISRLDETNQNLENEISQNREIISQLQSENQRLNEENSLLKIKINDYDNQNYSQLYINGQISKEDFLQKSFNERYLLQNKLKDLENNYNIIQKEKMQFEVDYKVLLSKYQEIKEKYDKANYELINNRQIHDNELYNIDSKINGLSKNVEKLQVENTELRQDNEKQRNSINMLISERDMYKEKFEDQKYKNDLLNKKIFEVENGFNEMMKRKEYERNSKRQKEEYHKNKNETKTKIAQELQSKIQKYRRERLNNRNYEDLD
jgi:chromosome segregation ATPase